MAITADILLAVAENVSDGPAHGNKEPTVRLANVHSTKYGDRQFRIPLTGDVEIDSSAHDWSNYFKAGLGGALARLRQTTARGEDLVPPSMDVLVDGTVPGGSGLSSSSAFVCASALAVLRANGMTSVDKKTLVELAIVSERAVGLNSGGYGGPLATRSSDIADASTMLAWISPRLYCRSEEPLFTSLSSPS